MVEATEVRHAVCTACGCTCDDVDLRVDGGRIVAAVGACALGQAYFAAQSAGAHGPAARVAAQDARVAAQDARAAGRDVPLEEALAEAARLLMAARYPLVYGFAHTTAEAQRVAVRLADLIGANIDSAAGPGHGAEALALQFGGMATCTLGEVKNRADLVIYWGCNPAVEYPHHFSRYTLDAPGRWVPNGRRDRTMVLVDSRDDLGTAGSAPGAAGAGLGTAGSEPGTAGAGPGTAGSEPGTAWSDTGTTGADLVLPLAPGQHLELLQLLRALVGGRRVTEAAVAATGLSLEQAKDLAERMKRARFGVIFFGPRLSAGPGGWAHVAAVHALATDLQQFTRFSALGMGGPGNEAANAGVLTAETGYPFAVNLSRGYPRYSPGEFTAMDLLGRGEVDAIVAVTSDPATELSERARAHLQRIPVIVINPQLNATSALAHVHLTTAPYGVSAEGTVYRTDEIPLPLRPALPSPYPTDEAILTRLCTAIEELKHA